VTEPYQHGETVGRSVSRALKTWVVAASWHSFMSEAEVSVFRSGQRRALYSGDEEDAKERRDPGPKALADVLAPGRSFADLASIFRAGDAPGRDSPFARAATVFGMEGEIVGDPWGDLGLAGAIAVVYERRLDPEEREARERTRRQREAAAKPDPIVDAVRARVAAEMGGKVAADYTARVADLVDDWRKSGFAGTYAEILRWIGPPPHGATFPPGIPGAPGGPPLPPKPKPAPAGPTSRPTPQQLGKPAPTASRAPPAPPPDGLGSWLRRLFRLVGIVTLAAAIASWSTQKIA
jgi:hypothetical protein